MLGMSINSLKSLELESVDFNVSGELLFIICLLKSSPNLVELIIKVNKKTYSSQFFLLSYSDSFFFSSLLL